MIKPSEKANVSYETYERAIVDFEFLSESNKLVKYVVAKGLLSDIRGKSEFEELISDLKKDKAYSHF
jgi:hypothetical protein